MRLFVSYASATGKEVRRLVRDLRALGHEVWFDEALVGGTPWWSHILQRIRDADAFVYAASPDSAASEACSRELAYAVALGLPLLPVLVKATELALLPPAVVALELVPHTGRRRDEVAALARALAALPPRPASPDPLPLPPEPPPAPQQAVAWVTPPPPPAPEPVPEQPTMAPAVERSELGLVMQVVAATLAPLSAAAAAWVVPRFTLPLGLTEHFVTAVRGFGQAGVGFAMLASILLLFGVCWHVGGDDVGDAADAFAAGFKGGLAMLVLLWGVMAPLLAPGDWALAVGVALAVALTGMTVGIVRGD
jgi:TIR domain